MTTAGSPSGDEYVDTRARGSYSILYNSRYLYDKTK